MFSTLGLLVSKLLFSIRVSTISNLVLSLTLMDTRSYFIRTMALFDWALSLMTTPKTARVWRRQIWSLRCRHLLTIHQRAKLVKLLSASLVLLLSSSQWIGWVLHLQLRVDLSILLIKELVSVLVTLIISLKLILLQMRVDLIFIRLRYSTSVSTWLTKKTCI